MVIIWAYCNRQRHRHVTGNAADPVANVAKGGAVDATGHKVLNTYAGNLEGSIAALESEQRLVEARVLGVVRHRQVTVRKPLRYRHVGPSRTVHAGRRSREVCARCRAAGRLRGRWRGRLRVRASAPQQNRRQQYGGSSGHRTHYILYDKNQFLPGTSCHIKPYSFWISARSTPS